MTPDPRPDWTRRPAPAECTSFHARYIAQVPEGDVLAALEDEGRTLSELLRSIPSGRERFAYAPGKWTVREIVGHVADTERVLTLRALWFARGGAPLPPFEENDWARISNAGERPLADLIDELDQVRRATLLLFRGFDAAALERRGVASGFEFSTCAMVWVTTGHAIHHRRLLQERYLS